ncbi:hypothetical protein F4781DRAFT_280521 [Annulohypoxylon bovei var. microspora]|nr:hypothetical protein F4781DRAFT_280521 [Annulohypoxylon bovei var. microspora]
MSSRKMLQPQEVGKQGTSVKKCDVCRKKKQGCHFANETHKCDYCQNNGFGCSTKKFAREVHKDIPFQTLVEFFKKLENSEGSSLLHVAAAHGNPEIIQAVLKANPATKDNLYQPNNGKRKDRTNVPKTQTPTTLPERPKASPRPREFGNTTSSPDSSGKPSKSSRTSSTRSFSEYFNYILYEMEKSSGAIVGRDEASDVTAVEIRSKKGSDKAGTGKRKKSNSSRRASNSRRRSGGDKRSKKGS